MLCQARAAKAQSESEMDACCDCTWIVRCARACVCDCEAREAGMRTKSLGDDDEAKSVGDDGVCVRW